MYRIVRTAAAASLLGLLSTLSFVPVVNAVALYDTLGSTTLTIVSITGDVLVTRDVGPGTEGPGVFETFVTSGGGIADGDGDVTPPPPPIPIVSVAGDTIEQMNMVSGSAAAAGDFALSDVLTTGLVRIEADPLGFGGAVEFLFEWDMMASASVMFASEFASAVMAVGLRDLKGDPIFGPTGIIDEIFTPPGGGMAMSSGMVGFTITVAAGDVNGVLSGLDSMGVAAAAEPVSLWLMALGLGALVGMRARRSTRFEGA